MSKVLSFVLLTAVALIARGADDMAVARQALRDGLWEIARTHVGTNSSPEARLVVLESFAGEGKWKDVADTLKKWNDARGPGFDYYRAIVKGDHAQAMEILRKAGSVEGCIEADLFVAGELMKAGKREEAEAVWRSVVAVTNVSRRAFVLASANLMDEDLLRKACKVADTPSLRRMAGLRLGMALLRDAKTAEEGERLIRAVVRDSPDVDGAKEALLAVADAALSNGHWKSAFETYHEAIEIWPEAAKVFSVQEGRGWSLRNLGRREEALEAFRRAGELATDDETRAREGVAVGDILQELGHEDRAMSAYRKVLEDYPKTEVAVNLRKVVAVRELVTKGRDLYRNFRFAEAVAVFDEVAKADAARRPMMDFYAVLCLYGQGHDDDACERARKLAAECPEPAVRMRAMLWLAKFLYNRREWKESVRLFVAYADAQPENDSAAVALLWAARASFADGDFPGAIQFSTRIAEKYPDSKSKAGALLVQGEALIEQVRFDEAILVFERAAVATGVSSAERVRALMLKGDALYALGADNPSRFSAALEAYRAIRFGGQFSASEQIVISYKIARTLEKLKRLDEAFDAYYTQVVLAYRENRLVNVRLTDEACAAFSRAAFRLADEFESRGRDRQALNVLRLVSDSDVPAAEEAVRRIVRIENKGGVL